MTHEERILVVDGLLLASNALHDRSNELDGQQRHGAAEHVRERSTQMRELGHRLMTGEDVVA